MASINQRGGKLFFDYRWQGKRHREYTDLPDTPGNFKKAQAVLKHPENDLRKGTFALADYFPDSPHLTAATLWLAAGENPEWIARQLGHSAQMLFSTYARYVPNLTRRDGPAFEALLDDAL